MTKPSFEALSPLSQNSFLVRTFDEYAFKAPYHFHPELELTIITKGVGTRFVGNHMEAYAPGDLVLLGSNLPHCWKTENLVSEKNASSIVIQFNEDFLGNGFFTKPELAYIRQLMQKSAFGIKFSGGTVGDIKEKMKLIALEDHPFKRVILLLEILQGLAESRSYELLDQQRKPLEQSSNERERINAIQAYVVDNFCNKISLEEAAGIAKMTRNAFCKYYKKTTRKTFMETVIDYRVKFATQLLIQTDKQISEICFESGFGDVSYFHKTFKNKMKLSPYNYRKKFMKDVP